MSVTGSIGQYGKPTYAVASTFFGSIQVILTSYGVAWAMTDTKMAFM